ncbi:VWA domain-containing protein [Pseudomonas sp. LS-2]|uniref:VWA domain-containing protein n=1 Tax=Pseudomonas sp. LS-2 TaxID=2315859 RepID=UPI000E73EB6A|nr:VWA domain-containing protein [Pseudomonas sp. LS-2]RJX72644.1 VWA domain-containing protein [Pseudomonas sp. LS-2]
MQSSLTTAFPIVARYYTDDLGVKIIWGGNQPATKDKILYLPMLSDESPLTTQVALGWTAHESAHIKYTQDDAYDKAASESAFSVGFLNVLEDLRIEKRMMADHFSTINPLTVTAKEMLAGKFSIGGTSEAALLHNACLGIGRARLLNQPLKEDAALLEGELKKVFGLGRSTKILGLLSQVADLPDTWSIYNMMHRMLDVLDEEDQQDPQTQSQAQQPQQQNQANDQQQDKGDGDQQGGGQSGDDCDGENQQHPAGSAQNGADDADENTGKQPGPNLKKKILSASDEDLKDAIADIGKLASDMLAQVADPYATTPSLVIKEPVGSSMLGRKIFENGQAASMGLRQVLNSLVQGSQNARVSVRSTGSKIEGGRLARVRVGENRIFRRQEPVQRTHAAIELLVDGSSSMGTKVVGLNENLDSLSVQEREAVIKARKSALQIAEESAYAIMTALEGVNGVSTGAMVFPKSQGGQNSVAVLKRHNQSLANAFLEGRFGSGPTGTTPLANAIWPAAGDLLHAKGDQKVMIIITDGDPDDEGATKEMVDRCRRSGIEVFAIAFGSAHESKLQSIFGRNKWELLADISQLRHALSNLVQQVLIQAA